MLYPLRHRATDFAPNRVFKYQVWRLRFIGLDTKTNR